MDDTPANLIALEAVLGDRFELVGARSGPESLSILERDSGFDVILMDVQMPGMDGYEAAARIKKMPEREDIPLVFVTAVFREDPDVRRGYEVGAVDYFSKPFDPDLLRLKLDVYASFRHRSQLLRVRERQVRESEEVLRAGRELASILERLPMGLIVVDLEGRVCQTNDEVLRIIGSAGPTENRQGRVLEWCRRNAAIMNLDRSPLARPMQAGEALDHRTVCAECLDGTSKSLLGSLSPLRAIDGTVTGAVVVLLDLAQHRKVEADFEACIARLASIGLELEGPARGSADGHRVAP
ncbi:MAG: response regulator [Polyangiaceae bacterium]